MPAVAIGFIPWQLPPTHQRISPHYQINVCEIFFQVKAQAAKQDVESDAWHSLLAAVQLGLYRCQFVNLAVKRACLKFPQTN